MDAAKKKPVMIGIIVVCLGTAAFITFRGSGGVKIEEIPEDATIWVKCVNLKCNGGNTIYETSLKEYRDFQKEYVAEETTPGMTCAKCGKPSVFEAMKCPKCGNVFVPGEAGREDLVDRCPKCKYSQREEERSMESTKSTQNTESAGTTKKSTRRSSRRGGGELE